MGDGCVNNDDLSRTLGVPRPIAFLDFDIPAIRQSAHRTRESGAIDIESDNRTGGAHEFCKDRCVVADSAADVNDPLALSCADAVVDVSPQARLTVVYAPFGIKGDKNVAVEQSRVALEFVGYLAPFDRGGFGVPNSPRRRTHKTFARYARERVH